MNEEIFWTGVFHMLTFFSFLWIGCLGLDQNPVTSGISERLHTYRKLLVLEKWINSCMRHRVFLTIALVVPNMQIFFGFMSIKMLNSKDADISRKAILLYFYWALTIFSMLTFTSAAKVNTLSDSWLKKQSFDRSHDRKVLNSLIPLKLEFGNNFVEGLTPLVVQEFCVRQTASLLMSMST